MSQATHLPFLTAVGGHVLVHDPESGVPLASDWRGLCVDGSDTKKFWYIGIDGGERSFTALRATDQAGAEQELAQRKLVVSLSPAQQEALGEYVRQAIGSVDMVLALLESVRASGDFPRISGEPIQSYLERALTRDFLYGEHGCLFPSIYRDVVFVDQAASRPRAAA